MKSTFILSLAVVAALAQNDYNNNDEATTAPVDNNDYSNNDGANNDDVTEAPVVTYPDAPEAPETPAPIDDATVAPVDDDLGDNNTASVPAGGAYDGEAPCPPGEEEVVTPEDEGAVIPEDEDEIMAVPGGNNNNDDEEPCSPEEDEAVEDLGLACTDDDCDEFNSATVDNDNDYANTEFQQASASTASIALASFVVPLVAYFF